MAHIHLLRLPLGTVDLSLLHSSTSVFLSLLASLVILATLRAAVIYIRPKVPVSEKVEKQAHMEQEGDAARADTRVSSWGWGLISWESVPTLPISLKAVSTSRGSGEAPVATPLTPIPEDQEWRPQRHRGPTFERPLPALYQTEVPASMAKMIMSRHTLRKPTQRPPSRGTIPSPTKVSRRPPSMV